MLNIHIIIDFSFTAISLNYGKIKDVFGFIKSNYNMKILKVSYVPLFTKKFVSKINEMQTISFL